MLKPDHVLESPDGGLVVGLPLILGCDSPHKLNSTAITMEIIMPVADPGEIMIPLANDGVHP